MKIYHDLTHNTPSLLNFKLNSKLQTHSTLKSFPNSENWGIEASNFSYVFAIEVTIAGWKLVVASFLLGALFSAKGCDFTSFGTTSMLKGSSLASYTFRDTKDKQFNNSFIIQW